MSEFRSELLQMPRGAEACEWGQLPHKMCTSEVQEVSPSVAQRCLEPWWLWEPSLDRIPYGP